MPWMIIKFIYCSIFRELYLYNLTRTREQTVKTTYDEVVNTGSEGLKKVGRKITQPLYNINVALYVLFWPWGNI